MAKVPSKDTSLDVVSRAHYKEVDYGFFAILALRALGGINFADPEEVFVKRDVPASKLE